MKGGIRASGYDETIRCTSPDKRCEKTSDHYLASLPRSSFHPFYTSWHDTELICRCLPPSSHSATEPSAASRHSQHHDGVYTLSDDYGPLPKWAWVSVTPYDVPVTGRRLCAFHVEYSKRHAMPFRIVQQSALSLYHSILGYACTTRRENVFRQNCPIMLIKQPLCCVCSCHRTRRAPRQRPLIEGNVG